MHQWLWIWSVSLVLVASACKGKPDETARLFHNALMQQDYAAAEQYATKASLAAIHAEKNARILKTMVQKLNKKKNQNQEEPVPVAQSVECQAHEGQGARCTICCDEQGKERRYEMVYEQGKWLVHYPTPHTE